MGGWFCETCDREFDSENAANQHMDAKDHWAPTFTCQSCDREFCTQNAVNQHMDAKDHWFFPCETCDRGFRSQDAANQHMNDKDHWAPTFPCETCDREFNSEDAANQHMDAKGHWAPTYPCETRDREFHSELAALQQMALEDRRAPPFSCEACGQRFYYENVLSEHIVQSKHWPAGFVCDVWGCSTRLRSLREMSYHLAHGHSQQQSWSARLSCFKILSTGSDRYRKIKHDFESMWLHPNKTGSVQAIYLHAKYETEPCRPGYKYLFHGTRRACYIAEDPNSAVQTCDVAECSVCCILRDSFKIHFAGLRNIGTSSMFGRGIYTTSTSSKADHYVMNSRIRSHKHIMLLCLVFVGQSEKLYTPAPGKTAPSPGYESVTAATTAENGAVQYDETVVYREEAIVPVGLIVYTRTGWQSIV